MRRINYAAQVQLRAFQPSLYSSYGEAEGGGVRIGADPISAVAGAIGAGFGLTSTIIGAVQAPKTREHEEKMAKQQRQTARLQREAAEAAAAAAPPYTTFALVGGVVVLSIGGLYILSRRAA